MTRIGLPKEREEAMRRISTLLFALTTFLAASTAWADATDEFMAIVKDMVSVAQNAPDDCDAKAAQLQAFLDKSATNLAELAPLLDTGPTPAQQSALETLLQDFQLATGDCDSAQSAMSHLIQMLSAANPNDMEFTDDEVPDVTIAADPPAEATPAKAKSAPPAAANVKLMCEEWRASVATYKHDCSALGKRLQRQFNALHYTLADLPTFGDHRKALIPCKKAVEEMATCAEHRESEAALELFGTF
ncbi:MAG: hypothetical protein AUK47_27035 [Deltaproteobacteria bacterium CG2_30_63_29]|nr:MAG: hypothetical protein AUK47_27035 [Deltaproteobacteria bacterium CG2_30_63_29]